MTQMSEPNDEPEEAMEEELDDDLDERFDWSQRRHGAKFADQPRGHAEVFAGQLRAQQVL